MNYALLRNVVSTLHVVEGGEGLKSINIISLMTGGWTVYWRATREKNGNLVRRFTVIPREVLMTWINARPGGVVLRR